MTNSRCASRPPSRLAPLHQSIDIGLQRRLVYRAINKVELKHSQLLPDAS